jgi:ankyrin repeat protein
VQQLVKKGQLDPSTPVPLGWDENSRGCKRGSTPLHLAVQGGHLKVVKFLLSRGARAWNDANAQFAHLQPKEGAHGRSGDSGGDRGAANGRRMLGNGGLSSGGALSRATLSLETDGTVGSRQSSAQPSQRHHHSGGKRSDTRQAQRQAQSRGGTGGDLSFQDGSGSGGDDDDDVGAFGSTFGAGGGDKLDVCVHDADGLTPLMVAAGMGAKKLVSGRR